MKGATPIGELARRHRVNRDLTLEALAERSGVSGRTISDIERGVSLGPQRRTVLALADALELAGDDRELFLAGARTGRRALWRGRDRSGIAPQRMADFAGREHEIDQLLSQLTNEGTGVPVVLSGAPGMGKTSIAVEALHRQCAGLGTVLFVDLGGLDEDALQPLQVLNEMIRQVSGETELSKTLAEAVATWAKVRSDQSMAIILDDAATESQIRPVLAAGERRLIVTSRRTLAGLEGVHHVNVGPLGREHSIALLRGVVPPLQASGDLDELAELCSDIPLALRIAGNRISAQASWTVEQFARRLRAEEKRLRALIAGDLAVEAAFELSYNVLAPPARALFRDLALLEGSTFSALVASGIDGHDPADVEDGLDALADLGLVEMLEGSRYRLHDLLRLFAASRLRKEVPAEQIEQKKERLVRWILGLARAAGGMFDTSMRPGGDERAANAVFSSVEDAAAWLRQDAAYWYPAFSAAADASSHEEVVATAWALHWYADSWLAWGHWHDLFAIAVESARATGDRHWELEHLNSVAFMQLSELFDAELSLATSNEALALARLHGSPVQLGWALVTVASAERALQQVEEARVHAREALDVLERANDVDGALQARITLAELASLSDPAAALREYATILAMVRDPATALTDHVRIVSRQNALGLSARILLSLDRPGEAVPLADELLALADITSSDTDRARAYRHRGVAHAALGLAPQARDDLLRAIELAGESAPAYWYDDIRAVLAALPD